MILTPMQASQLAQLEGRKDYTSLGFFLKGGNPSEFGL